MMITLPKTVKFKGAEPPRPPLAASVPRHSGVRHAARQEQIEAGQMAMIAADRLTVGGLGSAGSGLSLMLPRSADEHLILFAGNGETRSAILLDEPYAFHALDARQQQDWKGLILSGASIEVDPASLFDPRRRARKPGAIVRENDVTGLVAKMQDPGKMDRLQLLPLLSGLRACDENEAAGFMHWQISIGEGVEKQVLHSVDVRAGGAS